MKKMLDQTKNSGLIRSPKVASSKPFQLAEIPPEHMMKAVKIYSALNFDRGTMLHSIRCANTAYKLASALELPEFDRRVAYLVGALQDVGKENLFREHRQLMETPRDLLTEEQKDLIRAHVSNGEKKTRDICEGWREREAAAAGVGCHHEHLDGSGYPNKLNGDQIPISARIVTPIDVFDAMMQKRRYRTWSMTKEEAVHYLVYRKTWFDEQVLRKLIEIIGYNFDSVLLNLPKMLKKIKEYDIPSVPSF